MLLPESTCIVTCKQGRSSPALEELASAKGASLLGGHAPPRKFLYLDALKCCFLHSPGYFLSKITENLR